MPDTYFSPEITRLAAGLGIGTTTAYWYITEAVNLLDGTLLPIDRIAAPFYSGEHKKHGMNVQVIADLQERLLWASPALADAVHDVRAAREHGIIEALAEAGITCWADKGYQGAGGTVRLPYRGRWGSLSTGQQAVNGATQRSAHRSSGPLPPSSPGDSSASSTARRPGSRASSKSS